MTELIMESGHYVVWVVDDEWCEQIIEQLLYILTHILSALAESRE